MKVAVALITALVGVLTVFSMDLNQPEGCTIYELGDTFGEDWSPSVNFSDNISASVHSPKDSWQEFSFGFESLKKDPIGYLKVWKYSGIILTLRNSDRSNVGTKEETQKLPEDFVSKAFLKEWTVISLKRNSDTLMVDVDGKHAAHFTKVDIKPFHHVYAYVPPNQYINVGFNCPQEESLSEIVSQSEDPTESGAGAGVAVVIVLLLVGVAAAGGGGFWYWKKQKEKGESTWMNVVFHKGSKNESEAERGEKGSLLDEDGKIKDDGKKEGNLPISKNSSKVDLLNVGALFENGQDEDKSLPTKDEGGKEQDELQSSSNYNLTQDTNNETQTTMEITDDKSTSEGILPSKNTSGEQDKHEKQDTEICKQEGTEIAKEECAGISKKDSTEIGKEESTKITKEEGDEITREESAEITKDTQLAEDLLSEIESQIIPDERLMNEAQVLSRQNSTDFDEIAVDALDTMTSNQEHNRIQEGNEAVENDNSEKETTPGIDDIKIPEVKRDEKWDSDDGNRACVEEPCVQVITKKAGDSEYTQPDRIKEIQKEMPSHTDPSESGNDSTKNEGSEKKQLCDSMLGSSNQAAKDFMAIVGDPHYDEMTNRETPVFKAQSSSKTKDARKDSSYKYLTKHTP